jgi:O-antigen ligase
VNVRRRPLVDAARWGVILVVAAVAWTLLAGAVARSSPWPMAGLILGAGVTVGVSWLVSARHAAVVPSAIVALVLGAAIVDAGSGFDLDEFAGPLHYANASAALFALAVLAALLLAVTTRGGASRIVAVTAVVVLTPLVLLARVWAVAILLPGLVAIAVVVTRRRGARAAVAACGAVFAAALLVSLFTGAARIGVGSGAAGRVVGGTITEARVILWHEALTIVASEPVFGVGPGRFEEASPTASRDRDLRWAHNEFLQVGAETGMLGYLLSVGLFAWGFLVLYANADGLATALGAAALALVGAHANVDYILHFPAVGLAGAALLGTAVGVATRRREPPPVVVLDEPVREFA